MERLLGVLGHPERHLQVVLVAGTNGKSTTARVLARLLEGSGLRVGLYTSPHLDVPHERIVIGDTMITDEELASVLRPVVEHERDESKPASWFELMTATAVRWFTDQGVDVAVVETGLGGSGDATAALGARIVVVTSVAIDHVEYFGATRWSNAVAEAGAVPAGAAVVLGEPDPALHPPFEARCPSSLLITGHDFGVLADSPVAAGRSVSLFTPAATYDDVLLRLLAPWQTASASVALAAAETWLGAAVDDRVVRDVFDATHAPGRFELVHTPGPLVVDGAHNAAAAAALSRGLHERFARSPSTVVVGMTGERDPKTFLSALGVQPATRVICTSPRTARAMPIDALAAAARAVGVRTVEVEAAVAVAVRHAAHHLDGAVAVVTGSLYVAGEALPVARSLAS
ncbi:bifunctional folylpolyglutamate synthase/dihydrofolate synthase [Jiangella muralis]|uniref:bifunctional folylpolyglutamate synthase/dihydrofolate synthase n=1 Tax=Jiangella muralis TaxID=702383 RepID=UPI00146FEAC2|nr:cyanophycin synthetase [Jiangella muralis]